MKILNFGLELEAKKYKYESICFDKLVDKFSPKKQSPYTVEFINSSPENAEAVVLGKEKVLDFVLTDLEKIEKRLARSRDSREKEILKQAQENLESEKILSRCGLDSEETAFLKNLQLASLKPAVVKSGFNNTSGDLNELIKEVIEAAGKILFFTASGKEVKAWDLDKGETVLSAAGRIHSDLMRGFIRAEVANCRDVDNFFNIAEAKKKGLVKTADKNYRVESGDIIYIKFNV